MLGGRCRRGSERTHIDRIERALCQAFEIKTRMRISGRGMGDDAGVIGAGMHHERRRTRASLVDAWAERESDHNVIHDITSYVIVTIITQ